MVLLWPSFELTELIRHRHIVCCNYGLLFCGTGEEGRESAMPTTAKLAEVWNASHQHDVFPDWRAKPCPPGAEMYRIYLKKMSINISLNDKIVWFCLVNCGSNSTFLRDHEMFRAECDSPLLSLSLTLALSLTPPSLLQSKARQVVCL